MYVISYSLVINIQCIMENLFFEAILMLYGLKRRYLSWVQGRQDGL